MLETWKIFRETSSIKKTTLETRVILSLRIIRKGFDLLGGCYQGEELQDTAGICWPI
jgi:hypothetical protein